jgi:rhodanese-related sulfurtransferase
MRLPRQVPGQPGLVEIDATWGTIQPLEIAPGVTTVAELEVISEIERGSLLVDTRRPEYLRGGTLPTAIGIWHEEIVPGLAGELDSARALVLFCNGPQCRATPWAIHSLLEADWDPARLRYYRGGLHDWVTLGLPLEPARAHPDH